MYKANYETSSKTSKPILMTFPIDEWWAKLQEEDNIIVETSEAEFDISMDVDLAAERAIELDSRKGRCFVWPQKLEHGR
jgi:hypothetical protein